MFVGSLLFLQDKSETNEGDVSVHVWVQHELMETVAATKLRMARLLIDQHNNPSGDTNTDVHSFTRKHNQRGDVGQN